MTLIMKASLLLLLCAAPASCVVLRGQQVGAAPAAAGAAAGPIATPAEVKEKWSKMDDFLEIMFTIACKWQHGKDVNGEAAEKLRNGEIDKAQYDDFVMKKQADNVQDMDRSCGMITANGKKKCRTGCIDRWNASMTDRNDCDQKCVAVYDRFDKECQQKVGHLEEVYAQKLKSTAMRQKCYEGWCPDLPQVWMKSEADAQTAVDESCTTRCTPTNVESRCTKAYLAEVDFIRNDVTSDCHAQGTVTACFEAKKTTASTEETTCQTDGASTCSEQFETCKTDGQADSSPDEALAFCTERKKMCESQVRDRCAETFRQSLDAAKTECESDDETALNSCVEDTMTTKQSEYMDTCKGEKSASCETECREGCKVSEMNQCLNDMAGADGGEAFCKDLWQLLHESSEVDPLTGDPIVMIGMHSEVSKK